MKEWKSLTRTLQKQVGDTVAVSFQIVNLREPNETRPTINALFNYQDGECYSLILQTDHTETELETPQIEALEHFFKEYGTKLHSSS